MMGYGKFIFPVAVIDVAMFQELTAAGSDDFDQEVQVVVVDPFRRASFH